MCFVFLRCYGCLFISLKSGDHRGLLAELSSHVADMVFNMSSTMIRILSKSPSSLLLESSVESLLIAMILCVYAYNMNIGVSLLVLSYHYFLVLFTLSC
jgi:hypothetical protein